MTKQLNLRVTDETDQLLGLLQTATDATSKAEVVRRALALYAYVVPELAPEGRELAVVQKETHEVIATFDLWPSQ